MDFENCEAIEQWEFIEGRGACRRGMPWDPHQTEWWKAGYRSILAGNNYRLLSELLKPAPVATESDTRLLHFPSPVIDVEATRIIENSELGGVL